MKTVLVKFCVKRGLDRDFAEATALNVAASRTEAGVKRFEFFRDSMEANVFYLLETYHTPEDQARHRETEHYKAWKSRVADLLDCPYAVTGLEDCAPEP